MSVALISVLLFFYFFTANCTALIRSPWWSPSCKSWNRVHRTHAKSFHPLSLTLCNVPAIQDKEGFSCWNKALLRHKIIFRQDSPCLLAPSVTILFLFRVLSIVNWQTEWDLRTNTISRWLQIKRRSYPVSLSFLDWSKWTEVAFRRNWATMHLWAHLNLKRFEDLITRY